VRTRPACAVDRRREYSYYPPRRTATNHAGRRVHASDATRPTKASIRCRVPSIRRSTLARTSLGASGAARRTLSWHPRSAHR